jgi:hypothetical protein
MSFGHGAIVLGAGEGKTISVLGDSYTYKAANVRALRCRAFVLTCCRRDRDCRLQKIKIVWPQFLITLSPLLQV